jgi:hypothetical protein
VYPSGPSKSQVARIFRYLLATVCLLSAAVWPSPAAAQNTDHATQFSEPELRQWIQDYSDWRDWMDHNFNFVSYSAWGGMAGRKKMPPPPVWLDDECRSMVDPGSGLLGTACQLLKESREDYATMLERKRMHESQAQHEKPSSSIFRRRLHIDALWTATSTGASTYGLVGVHVTFVDIDRFQVFIPPGVMLFLLPDGRSHKLQPSVTMGVSLRLFDFQFPGEDRKATLHFNLAKAWTYGIGRPPIDVAGLSVSFRKK